MPTLAQITVTPEDKSGVARNAIRHGLTAKHLVVSGDETEEFEAFQQSLYEEIDPQGALETVTFHELLHAAWNLQRFRRIETALADRGNEEIFSPQHAAAADRLNRYQARAQRSYYRALQELRVLQTNRALRGPKPADPAAPELPVLAEIRHLTKQTQSRPSAAPAEPAPNLVRFESKAADRGDHSGGDQR